jgi:transcriptional regulator with XRE-family HTH domain
MAGALTQQELAEQAGMGRATIRSLEQGERRAHATTIRKLCAALRVEPSDLLTAESVAAAEEE